MFLYENTVSQINYFYLPFLHPQQGLQLYAGCTKSHYTQGLCNDLPVETNEKQVLLIVARLTDIFIILFYYSYPPFYKTLTILQRENNATNIKRH